MNLNLEHNKKLLIAEALRRYRFKKQAAKALGVSTKYIDTMMAKDKTDKQWD